MANKFTEIQKILDNPNRCLMVPELLAAIADEAAKTGADPFNDFGGHFVWQAIARDVDKCAESIKMAEYARHLIYKDSSVYSAITGIKPDNDTRLD